MQHIKELRVSNANSKLLVGFYEKPPVTEIKGYSSINELVNDSLLEVVLTSNIAALNQHITPTMHAKVVMWYHENINNVENVRRD